MSEIRRIQEQHRDILIHLEAHGYVFVGEPRQRGGAVVLDFYRQSDKDEAQIAEGELSFWLADLDAAKAARERIAKTTKPRRKQRAPKSAQTALELEANEDTLEDFYELQRQLI